MKQYRHRRSSNPSNAFPTLEPGELSVNTANRQLAAGDAASGTVGAPLPLIAVRYFDARGKYAVGDYVVNAGTMYKCTTAHGPAAFNPSNFEAVGSGGGGSGGGATLITSTTPPTPAVDNSLWWDSDNGLLYLRYNDGNSSQWVLASPIGGGGGSGGVSGDYLPLTGGTLTGDLTIGADLFVTPPGGALPEGFTVSSYDGPHTYTQLTDFNDSSYGEGSYFQYARGTHSTPLPVQTGDELGYVGWAGYDGTKFITPAALHTAIDGSVSVDNVPMAIVLRTGSGGWGTERLRIESGGAIKANGPLWTNTWFYNESNVPGIPPALTVGGLAVGWNYSNGQGEVNLVSRYAGQTGFWFQNWNGSAMATWAKIDVNGLDVQNNIKLHGASPYMPQMQIYSSTPDATAGYLLLTKSRNGGVVQVNDGLGAIVWTGYTADGQSRNSPSITSNVLAVGTNWVSADLSINTIHTDGSYGPRINVSGNAVSISPPLLTESYARIAGGVTIGVPITGNDPSYKLTDSDNTTYANYFGPSFMAIDTYGVQSPILSFDHARGTLTASTAVQAGDNLGQITWSAQTGPNPATDWVTPAALVVTVDAPVTGGVAPAAFNFISNGNTNLFIASDGRLTVRADPVNPLHLATKQYVDAGVRAINNVTATAYTLVLTDTGKLLSVFNGPSNAVSITVPLNATVAFAIGAQIDIASSIANVVTIVPASGVIMNSEDSKRKLPKQGSCATLVKVSTDVWVLSGSLMA